MLEVFCTTELILALLVSEVIIVRYKPFWTGDKVITIVEYEGVPSGATGEIHAKWAGTAYVVKIKDGTFRWLNSTELHSTDPNDPYQLKEGDIGVVSSI